MAANIETLKASLVPIDDLDLDLLLAGFTVLSKDMAEFLAAKALSTPEAQLFFDCYLAALNVKRAYWEKFGMKLYRCLADTSLPGNISKDAEKCQFNIEPLQNTDIVEECTRHPGWELVCAFREHLQEVLCSPDSVVPDILDGTINEEDAPASLAAYLQQTAFSDDPFWCPWLRYLAVLLIRTGLEEINCPPEEEPEIV